MCIRDRDWVAAKANAQSAVNTVAEKTGLSTGEVVGIVVGSLLGLLLFGACACACCCKKKPQVEDEGNSKTVKLIPRDSRNRKSAKESSSYGGMLA